MKAKLLIDSIMRQTTVLIAQLSTAAGIRAPLAHLADQVFLNLANEIEAQGVGRKVVADMFGLALRSYQKKVQRLTGSATTPGRTLWEAVLDFLRETSGTTRHSVFERFRDDGEADVAAVLNDLVGSGLVRSVGRGDAAVYRLASEADRRRLLRQRDADSVAAMAWLWIYRRPRTEAELRADLPVDPETAAQAVAALIAEGRIRRDETQQPPILRAESVLIPVGEEKGWEAAVFDHFRAVANAIASKVRQGTLVSSERDVIGGATLSFDVEPGHPYEAEVYGLLAKVRGEVNALWNLVSTYNRQHPVAEDRKTKVTFYIGQNLEPPASRPSEAGNG